jgi:cytochrome c2
MKAAAGLLMAAGGVALLGFPAASIAEGLGTAPVAAGERAFQKCYSCHALGDTDEGAQGPSLKGIVGRPVASWQGYDYSPALRAYARQQPRWSRKALNAFLADPQKVAPDNEMGFYGLNDAAERAALVDWLAAR